VILNRFSSTSAGRIWSANCGRCPGIHVPVATTLQSLVSIGATWTVTLYTVVDDYSLRAFSNPHASPSSGATRIGHSPKPIRNARRPSRVRRTLSLRAPAPDLCSALFHVNREHHDGPTVPGHVYHAVAMARARYYLDDRSSRNVTATRLPSITSRASVGFPSLNRFPVNKRS
jgi:hypothetical protein